MTRPGRYGRRLYAAPTSAALIKAFNTADYAMRSDLRDIIVKHGKLRKPLALVGDEGDLYSAGLDSLAVVDVMLAIEKHFDIEFPDACLNRRSFESIVALERAVHAARV